MERGGALWRHIGGTNEGKRDAAGGGGEGGFMGRIALLGFMEVPGQYSRERGGGVSVNYWWFTGLLDLEIFRSVRRTVVQGANGACWRI